MDKRTILALVLMALVIVVTPRFFASSRRPAAPSDDSTKAAGTPATSSSAPAPATQAPSPTVIEQPIAKPVSSASPASIARVVDSAIVVTPREQITVVNPGAVPAAVRVTGYRDLRPDRRDTVAVIAQPRGPLLHYRLAAGSDTVSLDSVRFSIERSGSAATFSSNAPAISITYEPTADGYRTTVRGRVANAPPGSTLLIDLPSELHSIEADTADDLRHLAYGYKMPLRDVSSISFSKLDVGQVRVDTGSFQWVSVRTKYWLVALMQPVGAKPAGVFRGLMARGAPRAGKIVNAAYATTSYPLVNGEFVFDLYAGPQSWRDLHALGNDLENVNPYAGWLHAVVQPFATIVMRVLLWMKATLRVNYGWVLVLFGIVIRLMLWPLNQRAMRSSIQMQRLQPELTELQKRYKNEPEKQREAMVKLYQAHGMSPFSPLLGCLPMLLPMPILFALYFVFQNTIEFRGVSFLWLPDISLRDPFYIIPIVMGASMFVLSWIGMRAAPPNPQAKMMSYMMPAMFTVMFLNFASGLNLYYAVQNIAALPQQWILTRERAKAGVSAGTSAGMAPAAKGLSGARKT
ncbi:MAG TPA: YidC/Oxa1 family insertase periplasmic-domain containing protein [Gemmatimonadaceae bacterium]|jgi:YidC/Oxa1 family membrane protein insertase|nr:YidC/Oxa1 family insertase periplasmic-domain containing protein [Gemmatimonadaceae bacterium]